jgi:hypothetical protein
MSVGPAGTSVSVGRDSIANELLWVSRCARLLLQQDPDDLLFHEPLPLHRPDSAGNRGETR